MHALNLPHEFSRRASRQFSTACWAAPRLVDVRTRDCFIDCTKTWPGLVATSTTTLRPWRSPRHPADCTEWSRGRACPSVHPDAARSASDLRGADWRTRLAPPGAALGTHDCSP